jgi:hypothetical protein
MYLSSAPDLFLYGKELSRIMESGDVIRQAKALAIGRRYGLRVKTLAGMAHCSETTVRKRLGLLRPSHPDRMAA